MRWILLAFALVIGSAQSQEPHSKATSTKKGSKNDNRGTAASPLVIEMIPTEDTKKEAAENAQERKEKLQLDRNLVEFTKDLRNLTGVLAIIGLLQLVVFGLQARRLRQTVEVTKEAAEALPLIERAYVFLEEVDEANGGDTITTIRNAAGNQVSTVGLRVKFTFRNHGKTPAMLSDIFGETKLCNDITEAKLARGTPISPGQVIGAGKTETFDTGEHGFDAAQFKSAKETGIPGLFFFGSINYADVLKEPRFTEFCWKFDFKTNRFRPTLSPERNRWS